MNLDYSLIQKIKRIAFTGLVALTLASGCKQYGLVGEKEYEGLRGPVKLSTDENPKGHKLKRVTHHDSKYELESMVINGKRYYTIKNDDRIENEADVILIRYEDHQLIRNTEEKKASLHSETLYIPTLITIEKNGKQTKVTKGSFATEGKHAIKAQIKKYDISNIDSEIIRENQNDVMFNIKSIYIPSTEREWYTPLVEDDKMNETNALPFYMIPVKKTLQTTDKDGKIRLESSEGIYRPVKTTLENYEKRQEERQKERAEEEKKKAEAEKALQDLRENKPGQFRTSPDNASPSPAVTPATIPTTQTTPPAPTTPTTPAATPAQKP